MTEEVEYPDAEYIQTELECEESFKNLDEMNAESFETTSSCDKSGQIQCSVCEEKYDNITEYTHHLKMHLDVPSKSKDKDMMMEHWQPTARCPRCPWYYYGPLIGQSFPQALGRHRKKCRPQLEKHSFADKGPDSNKNKLTYRVTTDSKQIQDSIPMVAENSKNSEGQEDRNISQSMDVPSGEYQCSHCNRSFLHSDGLKIHIMKIHHIHNKKLVVEDSKQSEHGHREHTESDLRSHEQRIKRERHRRDKMNKMFLCLHLAIESYSKNTRLGEIEFGNRDGNKSEPYLIRTKRPYILSKAIKIVHSLQTQEGKLKADKQFLLDNRSELAAQYMALRNQHYLNPVKIETDEQTTNIPNLREFLPRKMDEEEYLHECLSKNYLSRSFFLRVKLLDISLVSNFQISPKECDIDNISQYRTSQIVTRMGNSGNWLIGNKINIGKFSPYIINDQHESKRFYCTRCEKSFDRKAMFTRHIKVVHEKLKFPCTLCDKSFTEKHNLSKHFNVVHEKLKPFSCKFCKASFSQKNILNRHTNAIHHKLKPFSCSWCDKSFSIRSNLARHVRSQHKKRSKLQKDVKQ